MFDVHLTTIKVIDIENNKVVIDSTFGEKEYVLDKIKMELNLNFLNTKVPYNIKKKTIYVMYSQTTKVKSYLLL